jgi:hypothetical protein
MKSNVFAKSMLRQPLRSVLLALLLAVAAFSFVMRSVEYVVINEQINEISSFYRPVGFLSMADINVLPGTDVRPAADIVSASPYVDFDDRRRKIEAVLLDVANTGSRTHGNSGRMVGRGLFLPEDAFFYGTVVNVSHSEDNPYIMLSVEVDAVLLGYPEYVSAGQTLDVYYFMDIDEIQTGKTAIGSIEVGGRYFLRGVQHGTWIALESGNPLPFNDLFVMHPLSEVVYTDALARERYIPRDGVWYATAPPGKPVDLFLPGLESLHEELQWIRYAQSMVRLQTTVDMSYIPLMQPSGGARGVLTEGRWLSREDNELSRPVVAVHEDFARRRGLSIGDTIRIGIPPKQQYFGSASIVDDNSDYIEIVVVGEVNTPYAHTLELEIVGTFSFVNTVHMLGGPYATTFMYMPDSVLPPDVVLGEIESSRRDGGEIVYYTLEEGSITPVWYSFVLNDPRDADAFLLENRDALGELGFNIEFMPGVAGARAFWESAESILRTVSFNLALFSIVTVLILVLAVFLYIRQRQRDFAILRALGNPVRKTKKQLLSTLMLFALPAVMIGGAGGWLVAQNEAARALEALPTAQAEIGILWLPALIAIVLASAFILSLIGIQINRRPILEMLQGRVVK